MKKVANKHIVVVGAARSGLAVASLLKRKGADVFVTDHGPIADAVKEKLNTLDIDFEENGHTSKAEDAAFLAISPGVPTEAPLVQKYLKSGKEVFSEIEIASWFNKSSIVAVTGSNGKTTVTNWLDHTWEKAGRKHITAGNIGYAFSDKVDQTTENSEALLEVSSFQLDHIERFHPHISVLLNITADHLDRYNHDFSSYAKSKFRIIENQTGKDWFIYNYDDPTITSHVDSLKKKEDTPRLLPFSTTEELSETDGAFVRNQNIILKINKEEEVLMPTREVKLSGNHNLSNGLATALAARASEIKSDVIRESLRTFEGVEHRLELVRTVNGVKYINDSKATNINAVWYALDSFDVPMTIILGGRDKGNDYSELVEQIREKVHTIIAIGEARPMIEEQLQTVVPNFKTAEDMNEAVRSAKEVAKRGEVVLLSPACSSFDMYDNYEHRGNEFKKAVNRL
ncbi:MAG: UDP-N-acetylmuramoyl-L-alanine--D-glutamate ligase [Aliifodinibius sp.]|nr:UDP-N-acetylmuramoyl-L-alanine--D-glutamate ligase [candidate division KSB1 bacterium]NIT60288.1 UDP-N-acetylmuramoyl-L-alanine--D-glutamate ligase [Fodinibius sp.]NIV15024.1 UDP-N-acetylmuramoyl-L-alanine--D-glutamate ligase [Fodinibius sp.]NIY28870.1 UDP-N-acetylmuramoyl-L-alanine--D-glutamate ligase [Fodinibius sp.]